jgi:hypothetical protein
MTPKDISPNIKSALANEVSRKAPKGLHERIMAHVRLAHNQSLAAPGYSGFIIIGLLFAAFCTVFPFLAFTDMLQVDLPAIKTPQLLLPNYVWYSIFIGVLLFALDGYINRPKLKKA